MFSFEQENSSTWFNSNEVIEPFTNKNITETYSHQVSWTFIPASNKCYPKMDGEECKNESPMLSLHLPKIYPNKESRYNINWLYCYCCAVCIFPFKPLHLFLLYIFSLISNILHPLFRNSKLNKNTHRETNIFTDTYHIK